MVQPMEIAVHPITSSLATWPIAYPRLKMVTAGVWSISGFKKETRQVFQPLSLWATLKMEIAAQVVFYPTTLRL